MRVVRGELFYARNPSGLPMTELASYFVPCRKRWCSPSGSAGHSHLLGKNERYDESCRR